MILMTWVGTNLVISRDYQARHKAGEARALELAQFFERDTERILAIADVYVREAIRVYHEEGGLAGVAAFTEGTKSDAQVISHITFIDAEGTPVFNSEFPLRDGTSAADRPYFMFHQTNADGGVYISLPHEGRNSGLPTIRLVRRVNMPDGRFGGVAFTAVSADKYVAFFDALNLGDQSSATLVGLDKKIRARSSYGRVGPGQDISGSRLWQEVALRSIGLYRQTSVVDGITRTYAYRQLENYPLLVAIGLAEEDVLQDAKTFAQPIRVIAILTTLSLIVLTGMLVRNSLVRHRLEVEIQERRRTQDDLASAMTELEQYAYSASHDLKAPLATIWGLLDFCIEDLREGNHEELGKNLEEAKEISRRNAEKVESLLRVARVGRNDLEITEFSMNELIQDIWRDQTACKSGNCSLKVDTDFCELVRSDRSIVRVIIENLVSNALKYHDENKQCCEIHIVCTRTHDGVNIQVKDNGIGIASEHLGDIFTSFKSFDTRGGDGLGLALVRKQVNRLKGEIDVTSAIGEGSTFSVNIPV